MALASSHLPAQETGSAAADDPKVRFEAKFAEYKDAIRKIEDRRLDFEAADEADEADREQINAELGSLLEKTQAIVDELADTGLEAYRAAPDSEDKIEQMLLSVASYRAVGQTLDREGKYRDGGDQYEAALPVIEALIEGEPTHSILPVWGFVCAYAVNDFDLADRYLEMAKENQAFVDPASLSNKAESEFMNLAIRFAGNMDEGRQLWEEEQAIRAAEKEADDLPRVQLATSEGDIVLEMFENEAPIAVANFITLVKQGFYDGVAFHRVLPGFMAQGGDPEGTGEGGPGYSIACECHQPGYRKHFRGTISMAHAGRDTGGSQFFLTFVPTHFLDGRHTAFGRVIDGMEVLGRLQKRDPSQPEPLSQPDRINSAEVLRDRGHDYDFEKLPSPRP